MKACLPGRTGLAFCRWHKKAEHLQACTRAFKDCEGAEALQIDVAQSHALTNICILVLDYAYDCAAAPQALIMRCQAIHKVQDFVTALKGKLRKGLLRRIVGVTDLCTFPEEALEKPKASRTTIDTAVLSMEEVEVRMQQCKQEGRSPFVLDDELLARQQPGLILSQESCQTCDPSTSQLYQVLSLHQQGL